METGTIENIEKKDCTGCGLCAVKCPKRCIAMIEDKEGFRTPQIDPSLCVNCGLCLKVCPTTSVADALYSKFERCYYCGIISDEKTLLKSSSGGVFGLLARRILDQGGYICGVVYNEELEAIHVLTNKREVVEKMYGSKYVQSRAEQCFGEIEYCLETGAVVLFSGTACQIAALRLYLGKEWEKLYCVEILCHGVPSPMLFRAYKAHLEKKLGGKIEEIRFRDKRKKGWGSEHRTCVFYQKNGKKRVYRPILPAYFSSFFYGLNLRESCYGCRFATLERVADLTLGDFWGSWKKYGKWFHEGISVVGVNSEKGKRLFDKTLNSFAFLDVLSEAEAIASNDNFLHPVRRPRERACFYTGIKQSGYRHVWCRTYFTKTYKKKTLSSIYGAFVPTKIRFFLHRFRRF